MIEFFDYGSPKDAPGARPSRSGIEGDIETEPADEAGTKIEAELKDPSDDIELTAAEREELFGYSEGNPKCATKGGASCPEEQP